MEFILMFLFSGLSGFYIARYLKNFKKTLFIMVMWYFLGILLGMKIGMMLMGGIK